MALDFVAGYIGGCAGVLVGHPFDTVKVRLQTQDAAKPMYRGTWDCFRKIISQESARGLFKGMASPLYSLAFVNAIVFGVQGNMQRQLKNPDHLMSHFISGAVAGTAQSIVLSPVELAKTRMQVQGQGESYKPRKQLRTSGNGVLAHTYEGPFDCMRKVYHLEGYRGVFRGLGFTVIREAPSFGVYFVSYEYICRMFQPANSPDHEVGTAVLLFAGGMAGVLSWVSTYPVDVIKSRIQADHSNKYKGYLDCCIKSYQEDGFRVFSRGLGSTLLRAFPVNAATFATVAWTLRLSKRLDQKDQ